MMSDMFLLLLPSLVWAWDTPGELVVVDKHNVEDVVLGADGSTRFASRARNLMRSESAAEQGMQSAEVTTTQYQDPRAHPGCIPEDWAQWGDWSDCSFVCNNPDSLNPQGPHPSRVGMRVCYGGLGCILADSMRTETCTTEHAPCPVNCLWTDWNNWGSCSQTCGGGIQLRNRSHFRESAYGGTACLGRQLDTANCNMDPCLNNCVFNGWSEWSNCTATCGQTVQMLLRNRSVTTTPDVTTLSNCKGTGQIDSGICGVPPCIRDCQWSGFGTWSPCSCPNGTTQGIQTETQTVTTAGVGNGQFCKGAVVQQQSCSCNSSALQIGDLDEERQARVAYAQMEEQAEYRRAQTYTESNGYDSGEKAMHAALQQRELKRSKFQGFHSLLEEAHVPVNTLTADKFFQGTVLKVEPQSHKQQTTQEPVPTAENQVFAKVPQTGLTGPVNLNAERSEPAQGPESNGATNIVAVVVICLAILCIVAACLVVSLTVQNTKMGRAPVAERRDGDLQEAIDRIRESRAARTNSTRPSTSS